MNMHTPITPSPDEWAHIDIARLAENRSFSPPLPRAVLPISVREIVDGISSALQVPVAYVLTTIIVVTLGLIGSATRIRANGHNEAAALFGLNIGVSGARKSSAMAPFMAAVREIEKAELELLNLTFMNFNDPEVIEHMKVEHAIYRKKLKDALEAGDDHLPAMSETLKRYLSGAAAPAPILMSKVTPQGLLDAVAASARGVILYPDEIATLFANSGAAPLRESMLVAYSGEAKREVSRSQGSKTSAAFICSLVGGIQPALASKLKLDVPDGLLARFLVAHPDPKEIANLEDGRSIDIVSLLAAVRKLVLPTEILLSPAAMKAFARSCERWTTLAEDTDELIQGVLLRAAGNALRVALALEVLSAAGRGLDSVTSLSRPCVRAACDLLSTYYIPTVENLALDKTDLYEKAAARYLARKILEKRKAFFVIAEFRQEIGKRCRQAKMMHAAVEACIAVGILRRYTLPAEGKGRRAQACEVNPAFLADAKTFLTMLKG